MKNLKRLTLGLVLIIIAVIIFNAVNNSRSDNTEQSDNPKSDISVKLDDLSDKSSFNVLLIGTDAGGYHTDAIMLVNVNKENKTITMLSIPRDTKVTVDDRKMKINSCCTRYGFDVLIDEIKQLTYAPVHYYAMIQPGTLSKLVDCLGGVEYTVEQDMFYSDPTQDLYIDLKEGKQTLNGDEAEQYCRYRSYVMGDLNRTQCQQKFFKALMQQKMKLKYIVKIKSLFDIVENNVDTNVTFNDIMSNISLMQMISDEDQIECVDVPGKFNDMSKEGVSYYLIYNEDLRELREICADKFMGTYSE